MFRILLKDDWIFISSNITLLINFSFLIFQIIYEIEDVRVLQFLNKSDYTSNIGPYLPLNSKEMTLKKCQKSEGVKYTLSVSTHTFWHLTWANNKVFNTSPSWYLHWLCEQQYWKIEFIMYKVINIYILIKPSQPYFEI